MAAAPEPEPEPEPESSASNGTDAGSAARRGSDSTGMVGLLRTRSAEERERRAAAEGVVRAEALRSAALEAELVAVRASIAAETSAPDKCKQN